MARKKKEEEVVLVELPESPEDIPEEAEDPADKAEDVCEGPSMTDPNWSDYVLGQFESGELDENGRPYVHGLRRVARQLLGPIVESRSFVKQFPLADNGKIGPVTVEYQITFLWKRHWENNPGVTGPYQVTFSDVADTVDFYLGEKNLFLEKYPTATCSTRAEARVLRKALQLGRGVCAAEEVATDDDGMINLTQISLLNYLCHTLDIDGKKYINSGQNTYASIKDIPEDKARIMCKKLNGYQQKPDSIPDNIKGYKGDWLAGD